MLSRRALGAAILALLMLACPAFAALVLHEASGAACCRPGAHACCKRSHTKGAAWVPAPSCAGRCGVVTLGQVSAPPAVVPGAQASTFLPPSAPAHTAEAGIAFPRRPPHSLFERPPPVP